MSSNVASSTGIARQVKRDIGLVSYSNLDAWHSGDRVILYTVGRSTKL